MGMDFFRIKTKSPRAGLIEIYPDFTVGRSRDLMVRGKTFHAIWDKESGLWSTDEYDVQRLVDAELYEYASKFKTDAIVTINSMADFASGSWKAFRQYVQHLGDNSVELDRKITFANTEVKKSDYVSRRLDYDLAEGKIDSYNKLMQIIYTPEELDKIEWSIGAVISGDSRKIHKFLVLYGPPGTGKSTMLNVIQMLFKGYYIAFDASTITQKGNQFAIESFKSNPLLAIQHDGDLSGIEENAKLNSLTAHEEMQVNEKFKPTYTTAIDTFLILGTNKPVRITDAQSGIIRRLIDASPSGATIPPKEFELEYNQIPFELGAIAYHCLNKYRSMGKNYYKDYRPVTMMYQTDIFFNYIESYFHIFQSEEGITLKHAYQLYRDYCEEAEIKHKIPRHRFRDELKQYFNEYADVTRVNGRQVRSYYSGFKQEKFDRAYLPEIEPEHLPSLVLDQTESILDQMLANCPAQYANQYDTPITAWKNVQTTLKDIDTTKVHYVQPSENHIVIDFDIKDETGQKNLALNIEAASKFPPTYAELSKGGSGVHLHYYYNGDATQLSRLYDTDIEVKVFTGNSSLRRRLSNCNDIPMATISTGLPLKEVRPVSSTEIKTEQSLRHLILRNLNKEIHPSTKPSVDFIKKILDDAFDGGLVYDVTDLEERITLFAKESTNQEQAALKQVSNMKFKGGNKNV